MVYTCIYILLFFISELRDKTLASTVISSPGSVEREDEADDTGLSRTKDDCKATTTRLERNPVFVKDHRGEYISKLEDHVKVQSLIVQEQKLQIKKMERRMREMDEDCCKKIKKVNEVWIYKISKEGTRAGKMLKMSLQNQIS